MVLVFHGLRQRLWFALMSFLICTKCYELQTVGSGLDAPINEQYIARSAGQLENVVCRPKCHIPSSPMAFMGSCDGEGSWGTLAGNNGFILTWKRGI